MTFSRFRFRNFMFALWNWKKRKWGHISLFELTFSIRQHSSRVKCTRGCQGASFSGWTRFSNRTRKDVMERNALISSRLVKPVQCLSWNGWYHLSSDNHGSGKLLWLCFHVKALQLSSKCTHMNFSLLCFQTAMSPMRCQHSSVGWKDWLKITSAAAYLNAKQTCKLVFSYFTSNKKLFNRIRAFSNPEKFSNSLLELIHPFNSLRSSSQLRISVVFEKFKNWMENMHSQFFIHSVHGFVDCCSKCCVKTREHAKRERKTSPFITNWLRIVCFFRENSSLFQ